MLLMTPLTVKVNNKPFTLQNAKTKMWIVFLFCFVLKEIFLLQ